MRVQRLLVVLCGVLLAADASAQIVRRQAPRKVEVKGGAAIGFVQGFSVIDGTTDAAWDFGSGLEYSARLERRLGSTGIDGGVQASYMKLPLDYSSPAFNGEATAGIAQFVGQLRYGGRTYGFNPIYELAAGIICFGGFRTADTPEVRIVNARTDCDPKIGIGYGFSLQIAPKAWIEIIQEAAIVVHQREGLGASESNFPRMYVTRLGGKFAF